MAHESLLPDVALRIDAVLAQAPDDSTYQWGFDVLRWFLNGWIAHEDRAAQNDLALFAYARDLEGTIVPANSAKGYAILAAACQGRLVRTAQARATA